MSNFWARTFTGLSLVFILLAALFLNGWVFASLFLLILVVGLNEFYGLIANETCQPQKYYGLFAGILIYVLNTLAFFVWNNLPDNGGSLLPFLIPIPLFFFSFILEIYRKKANPLLNIATTSMGYLYIALPFSLLNAFSGNDVTHYHGLPALLTGYFALTWIYDTGAYLFGKQFGKHKFFERISPKKTWEGTLAGAIIAYLATWGISFLVKEIPAVDWFVMASLIILFGTHGDLAESLIKRNLNIKDSGNILPGHGGILDRFDTILLSIPFVFLYFYIRNTL